jgi:hypothetical protein
MLKQVQHDGRGLTPAPLQACSGAQPPYASESKAGSEDGGSEASPGSILLMHLMYRSNRTAREALPLVIRGLRARGFRIVPVGELLSSAGSDGLPAAAVRR